LLRFHRFRQPEEEELVRVKELAELGLVVNHMGVEEAGVWLLQAEVLVPHLTARVAQDWQFVHEHTPQFEIVHHNVR
jgi:hypothetical protein